MDFPFRIAVLRRHYLLNAAAAASAGGFPQIEWIRPPT
jgi:hypothetical protein